MQKELDFYWGGRKELWLDTPARNLPTRLFMSVGGLETEYNWASEARAFDELLSGRNYEDFKYEFHEFEGYRHGGIKFPTFSRGIPFIFEGYLKKQKEVGDGLRWYQTED